jgi:hypothetical protein
MMSGDPEKGRAANRRGQARQALCAAYLREHGYPEARHVGQYPGTAWQSDLSRVGPRVVEVTVVPWDKVPAKLRQAEQAAAHGDLAEAWVWKHLSRGPSESGSVADSLMMARAKVVWPLLYELDHLRKFEAYWSGR